MPKTSGAEREGPGPRARGGAQRPGPSSAGLGAARVSPDVREGTADQATHYGELDRPSVLRAQLGESGELERLGPYEVAGVLGRGGMGVVYEVVDQRDGTVYALKTIEARFLAIPESAAEQRFRQEISVLARLEHPGVVRLFDSGLARHPHGYEVAFLVMERLAGQGLDAELKSGRQLSAEESLDLVLQVAAALEYLSEHNVLHRDIKPANIFLEPGGRVVLMDFGLARSDEFTRLTLAGQIVGTFGYMSPERLCGKNFDLQSDVYSLGVVLFQLLAGHHPFNGTSPTETLELIRRGITLPSGLDELPEGDAIKALLLGMLAYKPEQRSTPGEVAASIRQILGRTQETRPDSGQLARTLREPGELARSDDPARPRATPTRTQARGSAPSELTPVIERGPAPREEVVVSPAPFTGGAARGSTAASQAAPYAIMPAAHGGPSWFMAITLAMSTASLTFVLGFFAGRTDQPPESGAPISVPILAQEPAERVTQEPAARPLERPQDEARPASSFNDAGAAYVYGEILIDGGRFGAAVAVLERALELNPAYADAHRRLGDAHAGLGDMGRAAEHYKSYLALRPGAPDADKVRRWLKALP